MSASDVIDVEYEQPACSTKHAWARVPVEPTPSQRTALKDKIKRLLKEKNAVMVSHYYVHPDLQDLAEETGGLVSDSLDMACPISEFNAFCDAHPDRTVVVYANTSAAVKARADWLVTSSCALDIVRALKDKGQKILWAPDKHLGGYIQRETGADMVFWEGACIVHDEFKAFELEALIKEHPKAKVLVHPESPQDVVALAHAVGSTSAILKAAQTLDADTFIVATDNGMLHKLRTLNPTKTFIEAPTAGNSATCKSCAHCPWMAMNGLAGVAQVLELGTNEIQVDSGLIDRARLPIDRMLAFTAALKNGQPVGGLIPNIGGAWGLGVFGLW